jgi:hypothetical protein
VPLSAFDAIGNLDRVLPDIAQDVFKNTGGSNISAERHYLLKKRQQLFSDSSIAIGENSRYGSDAYKDFETFDDIARRTYIKNLKLVQASHRDDVQNDTYGFFRDNFLATTASLQHIPMDAMFPDTHGKYWWPIPAGLQQSPTVDGDRQLTGIPLNPKEFPKIASGSEELEFGEIPNNYSFFADLGDFKRKTGKFYQMYGGLQNQSAEALLKIYNNLENLPEGMQIPPEALPSFPSIRVFRRMENDKGVASAVEVTGLPTKEGDVYSDPTLKRLRADPFEDAAAKNYRFTTIPALNYKEQLAQAARDKALDPENWQEGSKKGYAYLFQGLQYKRPTQEAPAPVETPAMAYWKQQGKPQLGHHRQFKASLIDKIIKHKWDNELTPEEQMQLRKVGGLAARWDDGSIKVDEKTGLAPHGWGTGAGGLKAVQAAMGFYKGQMDNLLSRQPLGYNTNKPQQRSPEDLQNFNDRELDRIVDAIARSMQNLMGKDGPRVRLEENNDMLDPQFSHPIIAAFRKMGEMTSASGMQRASDEELQGIADLAVQYTTLLNVALLKGDTFVPFHERRSATYSKKGVDYNYTFSDDRQSQALLKTLKEAEDYLVEADGKVFPLAVFSGFRETIDFGAAGDEENYFRLQDIKIEDQASGETMGEESRSRVKLQTIDNSIPTEDVSVSSKAEVPENTDTLHAGKAQELAGAEAHPELDDNKDGLLSNEERAVAMMKNKPKPVKASTKQRVSIRQPAKR